MDFEPDMVCMPVIPSLENTRQENQFEDSLGLHTKTNQARLGVTNL